MKESAPYSLAGLARYFLKLGSIGFGGPVALVGYMHRDLVEERRWISGEDYREGLALAQIMPGPLAAQLAMYLGYVHYRILGATVAGSAFVLPSFVMVVAIGWAYVRYGGLPWMQAAFYGVGAAVIGIMAISAYKLTARNIGRDPLLWAIHLATAGVTVWTQSESVWLFLGAGVLVWLVRAPPKRWFGSGAAPAAAALGTQGAPSYAVATQIDWSLLAQLGGFFAKAGAFVFGSGLAIVPFLREGVVEQRHWLTEREFLDAVAIGLITPGPVVITVAFIGYVVAGPFGAAVSTVAIFLPIYLGVVLPGPWFVRNREDRRLRGFVAGATAAAAGAIAGATVVLSKGAIVDGPTAVIAVLALAFVLRWKNREPLVVLAAALARGVLSR